MRSRPLRIVLPVTLLICAVVAVVLAASGGAAGRTICPVGGPPCLTASLLPGQLRVGSDGVVVARFQNQGPSTANHTSVSVVLPAGTTATGVSSSPAATCSLAKLSCLFGQVRGHGLVKMFVRFQTTASSASAAGSSTVTFDERNSTSPTVDTVTVATNPIAVSSGATTTVNGQCTTAGGSLTAFNASQSISAAYPSAHGSLKLPCTPVDTGVGGTLSGFTQNVVFVDLPQLSGTGLATVTLLFKSLPSGVTWQTFKLFEVPVDTAKPAFEVPLCNGSSLPAGADSCISGRAQYVPHGVQLTLLVLGTGGDPRYVG